jgi:hypothetical protein
MDLPVVEQHETRHGENRPKNCFFKVHLHSLNDDEIVVLLRGHDRPVTMDCIAKYATPSTQGF